MVNGAATPSSTGCSRLFVRTLLVIQKVRAGILIALLISAAIAQAETLTATVDRNHISEHETVELTLRSDSRQPGSPDLSPLQKDFDILGTQQRQQTTIINGKHESWRDWVVTLSPKRAGLLEIPVLNWQSLSSNSVTLDVSDVGRGGPASDSLEPLFIETEISDETPFVQEEVLLTLKIYYNIQLHDDRRISPLRVDGAIVHQLGETKNYESIRDGIRYGVFELDFSIHPQRPGPIEIPALNFTATMPTRRDTFSSLFSTGGKPVLARSAAIQLDVRPQPTQFTGPVWLPAKNLTLTDSWSESPKEIRVGEALSRTVTIEADGLTGIQLPSVIWPKLSHANIYSDQSSTDDRTTPTGIIGKRIEAVALIPSAAGELTLPAIRYSWYDTDTGTEKVAEIPAKTVTVLPLADTDTQPFVPPALDSEEYANTNEVVDTVTPTPRNPLFWPILVALLALLWLLTFLILVCSRRRKSHYRPNSVSEPRNETEKSAWHTFRAACKRGDPGQISASMIRWVQLLCSDTALVTLERCTNQLGDSDLAENIEKIAAAAYAKKRGQVDGASLLETCSKMRKRQLKELRSRQSSVGLKALYPR